MNLTTILSTDALDKSGIDILKQDGFQIDEIKLSRDDLIKKLGNYDAVVIRSATKLDRSVLESVCSRENSKLKLIARAGTGVDNIDVEIASKYGVQVINTPAANTLSAAEHTCALLCALPRSLVQANLSLLQNKWNRKEFMGSELNGKTLAIIGLGRIGREVATRMRAFNMTIIGYDPIIKADQAKKFDVDWKPLKEIWKVADFVTIHVPLLPSTANLIDSNVFNSCKAGLKLVNCSRGGIVNETDLLNALNSGKCGGAALDVFTEEPTSTSELQANECLQQLLAHPKIIATPHLGASTTEAQAKVAIEIAENIIGLNKDKSGNFGLVNRIIK